MENIKLAAIFLATGFIALVLLITFIRFFQPSSRISQIITVVFGTILFLALMFIALVMAINVLYG